MEKEKPKQEDIEELKNKVQKYQKQRDEYLTNWRRARADLINYKKEEANRWQQLLGYAKENFILNILSIVDNFEVIEKELSWEFKKNPYIQGVLQIKKQFQDFLKDQGLEEIKCQGEKFNPEFHEATEQLETKDKESGIIIEELKKGYKLNGKVIRPARVKITKQ